MAHLLDTDVVILYLTEDPTVVSLVETLAPHGIAISILTYLETYQGILRESDSITARIAFDHVVTTIPVLPFSHAVARRCAEVRENLRLRGRQIRHRAFDLVIAATALHHGLTLVTRNRSDHSDIPDLSLYEWQ